MTKDLEKVWLSYTGDALEFSGLTFADWNDPFSDHPPCWQVQTIYWHGQRPYVRFEVMRPWPWEEPILPLVIKHSELKRLK